MSEEIKEKYWSRFSATYDKNQAYVVGTDFLNEIKININKLVELGEVLELGCGTGYFTEAIVKNATHVFATDLSEELLENARKRLSKVDNVTIQIENCYSTSFESKKFDTVFMANLIHVVEDPSKVLQESFRVLKNDGLLIITSFTNHGMKLLEIIKLGFRFIKVWGKPPRHTHFSPDSLCSLIESTGFSIEESKILGNKTKSLFIIGKKKIRGI
jgi:ABC-2 type transport system ATP-binding protein